MEYKNIGTSEKMNNSPQGSPSANPPSGTFKNIGDSEAVNRNPVASPSSDPSGGKIRNVGDSMVMSTTPSKGWGDAANVPMSQRAIAQSKVPKK